jgi:predicted regulator of Ras-like GTPase activity (Roadblock/LC7/MglB family)
MTESEPVIPQVGVHGRELNWLVDRFVDETPGVAHAVVITEDGLLMAVSDRLRRDRAEQIAAVTAGMASLVLGAARAIAGGAVRQTVVEMEYGVMLLLAVADGSCLAVLAAADADLGLVGYEASMLVRRVGAVITPGPRSAPAGHDDAGRTPRKGPGAFGPASRLPGPDTDLPEPDTDPPQPDWPDPAPPAPPAAVPPSSVQPASQHPTDPGEPGSVRPSDPRRGRRTPPPDGSGSNQSSVRPVERASRPRSGRRPRR